MPSHVLRDKETQNYLEKTDSCGHTLAEDLQRARIYLTAGAAMRTATNRPLYAKGNLPKLELKEIKISLA